jgi:hypothetical protein
MRATFAIFFVAVVLTATTAVGTPAARTTTADWPGPPKTAPPRVKGAPGPPPAWLETRTRSLWLAFSSFCWKTTCADYLPPQSRTNLPVIRVRHGALLRVHFAFAPRQVHATTFVGATLKHATLRPSRIVTWRPTLTGVVSFDVRSAAGSASYVVRARIS